jgi:hypothetical protein
MKLLTVPLGQVVRNSFTRASRVVLLLIGGMGLVTGLASLATATTLEKLSVEQMAQQSTEIVRGRMVSAAAEQRNGVIYTRTRFQVLERWKGQPATTVEVSIPGGTLGKLHQTIAGSPAMEPGAEYMLFLWTGKSGVTQVIGLAQGVFDLKLDSKGQAQAARAATTATMLNAAGEPTPDTPVRMTLSQLERAIRAALRTPAAGAEK